jgi:glutamine amidotransferase
MSKKIVVIDYGMGNLRSVAKAVEYVAGGAEVLVTDKPEVVASADHIVFPGQGAVAECMSALHRHELEAVVREAAQNKPFLGICMGMQVLMSYSAENGGVNCLGLFEGDVLPFAEKIVDPSLKIPHMGWNEVLQKPHPLWSGIENGSRFYFVHSYYVQPVDSAITLGACNYGIDFTATIGRENVFAIQSHPEKSADVGLQLLKNFVEWDGQA